MDTPHGNATKKKEIYLPTTKGTIEEIKKLVALNKPVGKIYVDMQAKKSAGDQRCTANDSPRNRKQCENARYAVCKKNKLTNDEYFSTIEYAIQTGHFVRKFNIYPGLIVHLAHTELLKETKDIIHISAVNINLKQLVSYDTTFSFGNFYVSILACRNVMLVGDPIYPVAFIIHERESRLHHLEFLRDVLPAIGLTKTAAIPIVTDRERNLTKLLKVQFPRLTNIFCTNSIISNVEYWVKQSGGSSDDIATYIKDVSNLIRSQSNDIFLSKYKIMSSNWSVKFKKFFDTFHKYDLQHHVCDFVTKKFAAFKTEEATNNISESMINIMSKAARYKDLPLDTLVMTFKQIQDIYLYNFARARAGIGEYQLKKSFLCMQLDHSELPLPPIADLDNIFDEIVACDRPPRTVEKSDNYRMTQRASAHSCVTQGFVDFSCLTGKFSVSNAHGEPVHSVTYFPKPPKCSCESTGKCYHIFAVEMALGDKPSKDAASYSLSHMIQNEADLEKSSD